MSFLYDKSGKRKYLNLQERKAFLNAARELGRADYTFCATLAFTGARVSEVLSLTHDRIDFIEKTVIIECLKKRRPGIYRAVPVPTSLLCELDEVHMVRRQQLASDTSQHRLWPWSRTTGWKKVKYAMAAINLSGSNACPKGLRHSFGVIALQMNAPLNLVGKWLGHSRLSTTAIYGEAIGDEERSIARRFWASFDDLDAGT